MRGGNSFRTIYRAANHRQACAYVDNADDTYDVICWLIDECADISIHLTYVAYGAYTWTGAYINRLVWRGTVCANRTTADTASTVSKSDSQRERQRFATSIDSAARAFASWWRQNATQQLIWVSEVNDLALI